MENIMRGEIISREFQSIEWVKDENGKEYACYGDAVGADGRVDENRKDRCTDISQVLGDTW
jgi:hypothetical protein